MAYIVKLDPSGTTGRTELDLSANGGSIRVQQDGISWGDAAITPFEAEDQRFGSSAVGYRVPNRTVTIPLGLGMNDAGTAEDDRLKLQQKVGLIQREGGVLLRQRTGGPVMYADVVNATLTPADSHLEYGGGEAWTLVLECKPDFYGDPVTLDDLTGTGYVEGVLKLGGVQYAVPGDYPARAELQVKETSGNNQNGMLWGLRSRHYDAAASEFIDAPGLTMLNGTASVALAGSYNGNVAQMAAPPAGIWVPMLSTGMLTHQGAYRVWARVQSAEAPLLRLAWTVGVNAVYESNAQVQLPGSGAFYMVDLGEIFLEAPPDGPAQWNGVVSVYSSQGAATSIDCFFLQPVDEAAGLLQWNPQSAPGVIEDFEVPSAGATEGPGIIAWTNPGNLNNGFSKPAFVSLVNWHKGDTNTSDYLDGSGFGFNIPSGATIQGIEVQVERRHTNTQGTIHFADDTVQLMVAGARAGTNKAAGAAWATSATWATFGSSTDLWGLTTGTLTPAAVNASNFGVSLRAAMWTTTVASGFAQGTGGIGGVNITVYYTLAAGVPVSQDAVIYASSKTLLRDDGVWRYGPSSTVASPLAPDGDLCRIPPSGVEGRAVELLVKPSRGDLDQLADSARDTLTVTPIVRPCWLHRP